MLSLSLKMTMMLQRLAADPKTELKSLLVVRLLHNYGGVMLTLSLAKVQTATADARSAVDVVVDDSRCSGCCSSR
jgi:hypothetical protein